MYTPKSDHWWRKTWHLLVVSSKASPLYYRLLREHWKRSRAAPAYETTEHACTVILCSGHAHNYVCTCTNWNMPLPLCLTHDHRGPISLQEDKVQKNLQCVCCIWFDFDCICCLNGILIPWLVLVYVLDPFISLWLLLQMEVQGILWWLPLKSTAISRRQKGITK